MYEKEQSPRIVFTAQLNEQNKDVRKGVFLDIQRPVDAGLLIQQTVFTPNSETGKFDKQAQISLYPYDGSPSKVIIETDTYIDFTQSNDWFVWATIMERFMLHHLARVKSSIK
ncbi:hypothetical protein [Paenibacillus piri]|uniref:Uncharacterized protein n=1 Tax=Paenibacillus piri TaxID=2547395 RepID=A0A4R5KBG2_9BACL|nr:hypothetical protein [Paenibacillus piri]TDF91320.1 hypothetical protein E1757_32840 [Paenibacillus piri]